MGASFFKVRGRRGAEGAFARGFPAPAEMRRATSTVKGHSSLKATGAAVSSLAAGCERCECERLADGRDQKRVGRGRSSDSTPPEGRPQRRRRRRPLWDRL